MHIGSIFGVTDVFQYTFKFWIGQIFRGFAWKEWGKKIELIIFLQKKKKYALSTIFIKRKIVI